MEEIYCKYNVDTPQVWYTTRTQTYKIRNHSITIPFNFRWDGASVPRVLWNIIPRWGMYAKAALIHDWLYVSEYHSRKRADIIFYHLMLIDEVPCYKAWVMYKAVRMFGSPALKKFFLRD